MLMIGDSLTHASIYPQQVLDLCKKPGNPKLTLVGGQRTKGETHENRHEGYSGWTAKRFATHYAGPAAQGSFKKPGSPFVYQAADGAKKLDFARYSKELNEDRAPDFVTIFLGCNDTFGATEATLKAAINDMFRHYDTLVKMIRGTSEDTKIGVMLLVPPAATQDAFCNNYRCGQTRWQYKRNQHRVVERLLETYAGREAENISIVPIQVNLDCLHNYPTQRAKWNAECSAETDRLSNGVHPAASGYRQIGDTVYAWLKAQLANKK